MARVREFKPSESLEKAMELFWAKGFHDTSMDELVRHTGASRKGLYTTFGSKKDLFLASLHHYGEQVVPELFSEIAGRDASLPQLKRTFENLIRFSRTDRGRQGCFMCNTTLELAPHDSQSAAVVYAHLSKLLKLFKRALDNAVRRGELPEGLDTRRGSHFLLGVFQGVVVLSRSPLTRRVIEDLTQSALESLGA